MFHICTCLSDCALFGFELGFDMWGFFCFSFLQLVFFFFVVFLFQFSSACLFFATVPAGETEVGDHSTLLQPGATNLQSHCL